ncbi:hypothetical protein HL653_01695 [Sphingomonas sp. AP4-R1]|uniref:DUF1796 family putative cysteine peptidase n=1 Tax=Sphingomonas sp. AP4-R1 TaxID=2735134 RepID=UPI00149363E9|nr:DUF1796 family putative cysteine peptidase [Sphingomonas sp. AP4-R1]QJU56667.1 hypothetical protein HL653_01695 [Sphingomonas sp. AP4-R1]
MDGIQVIQQTGAERLVEALYYGILGRAPDAAGLAVNTKILEGSVDFSLAADMAINFLHSDEAQQKRALAGCREPTHVRVLSLGTHCAAAWAIKSAELKQASYPFDWIFSSADIVLHCLQDDFETFLDAAHYADIDGQACSHRFYMEAYGEHRLFNHRSPLVEGGYDYYRRGVARFRQDVYGGTGSLLFMLGSIDKAAPSRFEALADLLDQRAPHASLLMVSVLPPDEIGRIGFSDLAGRGRHKSLLYRPNSTLGPLEFPRPIDNLMIRALLQSEI